MRTLVARPRAAAAALLAVVALVASGCGDDGAPEADPAATESADDGPAAGEGDWLLRFTTAEGADGERARAVYVRYDPATGAASARALPPVTASDVSVDEQALLVSADHTRAITDTGIPRAEQRTGKLTIHSLTDDTTQTLDIREVTGATDLRPVAWAFDPAEADTLRVVDAERRVWKVDLAGLSAEQEGSLPRREGWIFGNGFDRNTGEPYIESIDSDETEPSGNGDADVRPVEREGGSLLRYEGEDLPGLPTPPCGFAGGFHFDAGVAWLFCAETPAITAYQAHEGGTSWHQYGTPSPAVVPAEAVELTFVLPPVG